MFPMPHEGSNALSTSSHHSKSMGFPTAADIKVFVNVIVSELNQAAPSQVLHAEVKASMCRMIIRTKSEKMEHAIMKFP